MSSTSAKADFLKAIGVLDEGGKIKNQTQIFAHHLRALEEVSGDADCETLYCIGLIYLRQLHRDTKYINMVTSKEDMESMSFWMEKSARMGYCVAFENLVVLGVGEAAERARKVMSRFVASQKRKDSSSQLPVYLLNDFEAAMSEWIRLEGQGDCR